MFDESTEKNEFKIQKVLAAKYAVRATSGKDHNPNQLSRFRDNRDHDRHLESGIGGHVEVVAAIVEVILHCFCSRVVVGLIALYL